MSKTQQLIAMREAANKSASLGGGGGAIVMPNTALPIVGGATKQQKIDPLEQEKIEQIDDALKKKIDYSHIKPKQTTYRFDEFPCSTLIIGKSGGGKTSYVLNMLLDNAEKDDLIIYVNAKAIPMDAIIVQKALHNKNMYLIETENYDKAVSDMIFEFVKDKNKKDKKPNRVAFLFIDNLFQNLSVESIKALIYSRHIRLKVFFLVHRLSSSTGTMAGLRSLATHVVVFKWPESDSLKSLGFNKKLIQEFVENVNESPNKYIKLVYDRNNQVASYE